ncbi:MAG: hypothetical protein PARBA_03566 [Parabacteroides sp.]
MRKIIILLGFFVGLVTSCTDFTEQLEKGKVTSEVLATKSLISEVKENEWIGLYPDSSRLANLVLFGSHDAGTFKSSSGCVKCQDLNIEEQLSWGIRVFDCRLSENMNFFHGSFYCEMNFYDFAKPCISFLQSNPREFIVVMAKAENAEGPGHIYNENFQKNVDELGREHFLFEKDLLNQPISKLRGKMVVVTRGYNKGELGYIEGAPQINWPDDTTQNPTSEANGCLRVAISDRYKAYPETKVLVVKGVFPEILPTLKKDPTRWFIFFTSGYDYSGSLNIPYPEGYTIRFRKEGLGVLKENAIYLQRGGTLMMDFAGYWSDLRNYILKNVILSSSEDLDRTM